MPTLDDVYRKFGEVSEAAQLIETELGTVLLFFGAVDEGIITEKLEADGKRATALMDRINHQTLGQLIRNTKRHTDALTEIEPLLTKALEERNRLSHHFYRRHHLRKNSDDGRTLMLDDLESIHDTLLSAYKALLLLSGTDLDALVEESAQAGEDRGTAATEETPTFHLPI